MGLSDGIKIEVVSGLGEGDQVKNPFGGSELTAPPSTSARFTARPNQDANAGRGS